MRSPGHESARVNPRWTALIGVICLVSAAVMWAPGRGSAVSASPSAAVAPQPFTASKVITRTNVGQAQPTDSRTFTVSVSQTSNLQERQQITVSWTGAHPTGGIAFNPNSADAVLQEYPVVLMECRGVDSSAAPAAEQVSPEKCWTHTPGERVGYDENNLTFPPYRADMYASVPDRGSVVGVPSPLPPDCAASASTSGVQHWVPFVAADGTVYYGGPQLPNNSGQLVACAGLPPEAVESEQSLQPDSTTYAPTGLDGTGSWRFTITTSESNASLGCSSTVPCTLEVIPIEGISCDPSGTLLPPDQRPSQSDAASAAADCEATGFYHPGDPFQAGQTDYAVSGDYWWSASNWRNRVAVPLQIAPLPGACDPANSSSALLFYGSELFTNAALSWEPAFCQNPKLFKISHVVTSEPVAKNLLASHSIEAALAGAPPSQKFVTPTVQAPVAFTGFSIGYDITTSRGKEYTSLKLTPRLLAKLMTESYPVLPEIKSNDKPLSNNPLNILYDPEFDALNPDFSGSGVSSTASVLFSLSGSSDVIWALTSYINSDPEARAWLNGTPDPWGMQVNPAYQNISLPVSTWPLLDTFTSAPFLYGSNVCLSPAGSPPIPYLPLVAAPSANMANITLDLQFHISNSQVSCVPAGSNNNKLTAEGLQPINGEFILGVVPYSDSVKYDIPSAALQSHVDPSAPAKFTDATGRTFVAPTDASLQAAAKVLVPDSSGTTWTMPYSTLEAKSQSANAYPGAMLLTLDVPTSGLPSADAGRYGQLLTYAASTGQTPGPAEGDLPAGYLPLTSANGLGAQVSYTDRAATAVANQTGSVPSLIAPPTPPKPVVPTSTTVPKQSNGGRAQYPPSDASGQVMVGGGVVDGGAGSSTSGETGGTGSSYGATGATSGTTSGASGRNPASGNQPPANEAALPQGSIQPAGKTLRIGAGVAGVALPLLLLGGLVAFGISLASWLRPRRIPR